MKKLNTLIYFWNKRNNLFGKFKTFFLLYIIASIKQIIFGQMFFDMPTLIIKAFLPDQKNNNCVNIVQTIMSEDFI